MSNYTAFRKVLFCSTILAGFAPLADDVRLFRRANLFIERHK